MKIRRIINNLDFKEDIIKLIVYISTVYLIYLVLLFYIIEFISNRFGKVYYNWLCKVIPQYIFTFPYYIYIIIFIFGCILFIIHNFISIKRFFKKYLESIIHFFPINWLDYVLGGGLLILLYILYKKNIIIILYVLIIRLMVPLIMGKKKKDKNRRENLFDFKSDDPIKSKKEDIFERENFVEDIFNKIKNIKFEESFVFGLYGE